MVEEVNMENGKDNRIQEVSIPSCSPVSDSSCETGNRTRASRRKSGPTRKSTKGGWTTDEDALLVIAVKRFHGRNWKGIAELFPRRTDVQCLHRWQKVLNPDLIKGPWTKEEDDRIIELVEKHGKKKWAEISKFLPGRMGKQCRERWHNHLNPSIKKDAWTREEEVTLIRAHQMYGNKWAEIAKFLPGRADNSIKNHWNCSIKKRLDSYLTSGLLDPPVGVDALDLNNHVLIAGCPKKNSPKKSVNNIASEDQKINSGGHDLVHQNASLQMQPLDFQTALDYPKKSINNIVSQVQKLNSGSHDLVQQNASPGRQPLDLDVQTVLIQDSERLRVEIKPIPEEDSKCTTLEVDDSAKPLIHWKDRSPTASGPPSLSSISNLNHVSTEQSRHVRNSLHREDPNLGNALDDSKCAIDLQPRIYATMGNKFSLQMDSFESCNKNISESPKRSPEDGSDGSDLVIKVMMLNVKDTINSSMLDCEFSENNKVGDNSQVPSTPLHCTNQSLGPLFYAPLQLTDIEDCLASEMLSNSESYIMQTPGPVHGSTPPNLSLSLSILRKRAKSFKNIPSILRKQRHVDFNSFLGENSYRASDDAKAPADVQNSLSRTERVSTGQVDFNNSDAQNVKQFFRKKRKISAATKSVERRLEDEFDKEWDGSSSRVM